MKKILMTTLLLWAVLGTALALDYRQVLFGNNYENIIEISADIFFERYPQVLDFKKYTQTSYDGNSYYKVYEQRIGESVFYRLVCSLNPLTEVYLLKWKSSSESNAKQGYTTELFMEEKGGDLIQLASTCAMGLGIGGWEMGVQNKYEQLEIIERKGKVIGILRNTLIHVMNLVREVEYFENRAEYALIDDIKNKAEEVAQGLKGVSYKNRKEVYQIRIEASTPLVDSTRPFMYTIQNAFDGNPATSYVENTEDDLMHIGIDIYIVGKADKILIINGYAQNETTYKNNNRVKELSHKSISDLGTVTEYSDKKLILEDITLDMQIQDWWGSNYFTVTDIYKGSKYTDTCLAELDFYIKEYGWLFGGDYE